MKIRLLLLCLLVPTVCVGARVISPQIEGCSDPALIAKAMSALQATDWQDVSLSVVQRVWPTDIDGLDCDPKDCHLAWSKGRIIRGHCECCETFAFEYGPDYPAQQTRELNNVVIKHAARTRHGAVTAAKQIGESVGLSPAEIQTLEKGSNHHFVWERRHVNERYVFGMEVNVVRRRKYWELYVNIGRNREAVPASSDGKTQGSDRTLANPMSADKKH